MITSIKVSYSLYESNKIPITISIKSLLENSINNVEIYIVHDNTLLEQTKKNLLDYINKNYNKVIIKFIEIEPYILSDFSNINYSSILAFYKLTLINELKDIDKILCLPANSIITQDLRDLYNLNIEDYYLAACEYIDIEKNAVTNDMFDYNVMLLNLKKMRNEIIFSKMKNYAKVRFDIPIKDPEYLYNMFFSHNWLKVENTYNYIELSNFTNDKNFSIKKLPIIINYNKGILPQYTNCKHSMRKIWWEYAKKIPFEVNELQSYKLATTSAQNSFHYFWLLSRIWPYIKPYWFRILLGFLITIPLGLLDGVTAFALKPYMDYVVGGKDFALSWHNIDFSITSMQMAYILPIGVVLFAALQGVLRYLSGYLSGWTSAHITNGVKFDLFHRLIHMHPQFFDDNSSGIVISRYMGDPGTASAGVVDNIQTITTASCGALGLIAVMVYSSWKLAFIGVLVLCIAFIPVALIRNRIKETSNKNMVIGGKITTNINETYSGNKVMAAYELQDRQETFFQKQVWEGYNIGMSLYKRAGWMSPMMYLIASVGIATVLGYGTFLITSRQMTAGSFASFVTSLLLLYKPVKTLGNTFTGFQNIFVAMGRIFELFDLEPAIKDCENPKELNGFNNAITFENVNFEYVPNKPILKNINLNITKNETLAIVGNSGGGKSTLVNLLPRFYDIKSGSIKFDGVDIKEYSLKTLRKNISMVFQDNFLYSGTIKENIMMGNPDATTEELVMAIKSAHLEDMISELPDGLDTELGERGLTLSGGQRQRVAIARAMLRNAPIVILDEATSALDNESEAIVQKAMDNLMQNRTVFIIAHRLSTIKNADRIAVINEGELVELGAHEELMNIENGQYKALYEMQFKKQEK